MATVSKAINRAPASASHNFALQPKRRIMRRDSSASTEERGAQTNEFDEIDDNPKEMFERIERFLIETSKEAYKLVETA